MTLSRRRWLSAALFTIVAGVLAFVPFRAWKAGREDAIQAEVDAQLIDQMETILHAEITGTRSDWPIGYYVNANDEYREPFGDYGIEPPLNQWIREAGGFEAFREYTVDDTGFRAYVRPTSDSDGFVTLAYTNERDERLDALSSRAWRLGLLLAAMCAGLGVALSALTVVPLRRLLGDQQAFLADAAHEMRTPLAVILASSSQALARERSTEEYVRSLAEIRSAAERASTGVNEMLDLVRFESGQTMPRIAPLRLDLLAEEVAASIRADGVEIIADPADPVVVAADMALLRQAIENVVRNAARRAQRVELITRADRGDGVIDIVDNGEGFDPLILPRVFERYQRGDRRGEAGIGLSIVRAIAVAHGGSVKADNRVETNADMPRICGAIVTLRIPLHRA